MKYRTKKRIQGSISLMLIIILLPSMLFSGLIVDLARINMAKAMISSAGDLTMNAALADYDAILKDVYGLFAIAQDDDGLYDELENYFAKTLVSNGLVSEVDAKDYVNQILENVAQYLYLGDDREVHISNLFDMDITADSVTVQGSENSTLATPAILKKQIVEYMKYRAPINCGLSFFSSLTSIARVSEQSDVVQAKVTAEQSTGDIAKCGERVYKKIIEYENRLYQTQKFWPVADKKSEKTENDSEGFIFCAESILGLNEKLRRNTTSDISWDYQLVTKYICGFLMDDKIDKVDTDFRQYPNANGKNQLNKKSDAKAVETTLKKVYQNFSEKKSAVEKETEFAGKLQGMANGAAQGANKSAIENLVKTKYDTAVGYYKALYSTMKQAYKDNSVLRTGATQLKQYLDAQGTLQKTYQGAAEALAERYKKIDKLKEEIAKLGESDEKRIEKETEKAELEKEAEAIRETICKFCDEHKESNLPKPDESGKLKDFSIAESDDVKAIRKMLDYYDVCYEAYTYYRESAGSFTDTVVKNIHEEASYLYTKAKALSVLLTELNKLLVGEDGRGGLLKAVDTYLGNLQAWEQQNQSYQSGVTEGKDDFSTTNEEEIKANRQRYDREGIIALSDACIEQNEKIIPFVSYLEGKGFQYGNQKIYEIDSVDRAIAAISDLAKDFANKDEPDINGYQSMYRYTCPESTHKYTYQETKSTELFTFTKNKTTDDGKSRELTRNDEAEPMLSFVGYLKSTYKNTKLLVNTSVSQEFSDVSEDTSNAETMYESLKANMETGGTATSDESDTKYGYTYATRGKTPGSGQPDSKVVSTDGENPSGSYASNRKKGASLGRQIIEAIENARDNIFVMEYIFGNFSYNTIVQDAAYENYRGEKDSFYLASDEGKNYEPYKALTLEKRLELETNNMTDPDAQTRPITLSGFPISPYNNEFYGAEIEYLLYGMESPTANVQMADLTIYGVRFLMNSIYAFTSTEIRNIARTAGLAVQAATLGTTPYQLVMVVIQLALAMSESLLDIEIMHTGAKVAVVPTKATWKLSPTGAKNLLQNAVSTKIKAVANDAIKSAVDAALGAVNDGIQKFSDCAAEEVIDNLNELVVGLESMASAKAEELLDESFAKFEEFLMGELNAIGLQNFPSAKELENAINQAFTQADGQITAVVASLTASEESKIGAAIQGYVEMALRDALDNTKNTISGMIATYAEEYGGTPANYLSTLICDIQLSLSNSIKESIQTISTMIRNQARDTVTSFSEEVTVMAKSVTTETAEQIKEQIIGVTNDYIDKSINAISDKIPELDGLATGAGTVTGSAALAKAIAFGYSDYLRMQVFLELSTDANQQILVRTANLIEANINYPNTAAEKDKNAATEKNKSLLGELFEKITWFFVKKGEEENETASDDRWQIARAYTYVQIDADIGMDMFFLKGELLNNVLNSTVSQADEANTTTTFHYHSVMGY